MSAKVHLLRITSFFVCRRDDKSAVSGNRPFFHLSLASASMQSFDVGLLSSLVLAATSVHSRDHRRFREPGIDEISLMGMPVALSTTQTPFGKRDLHLIYRIETQKVTPPQQPNRDKSVTVGGSAPRSRFRWQPFGVTGSLSCHYSYKKHGPFGSHGIIVLFPEETPTQEDCHG